MKHFNLFEKLQQKFHLLREKRQPRRVRYKTPIWQTLLNKWRDKRIGQGRSRQTVGQAWVGGAGDENKDGLF